MIAGGIVAGLVLIANAARDGGETAKPVAIGTTSTSLSQIATTAPATEPVSDVPAIDCRSLLTFDDTAAALAISDRPVDQRDSFLVSQSEVCGEALASDEDFFVRIEPGNPDDFKPGAVLIGTSGEAVDGIADRALWFGGDRAEGRGTVGLLSVGQDTPLGALHFRIVLGRPDLDESAQREVALGLARTVLPRFPGAEVEKPESLLVRFEEAMPEDVPVTLFDNLVAKEATGEWTTVEGLVASLGLIAGENETSQVLGEADLLDRSATGVISLAQEYLQTGTDEAVKAEIERLLDVLILTQDQLDQMTQAPPLASGLLVSLAPMAQVDDPCLEFGMESPCLVQYHLPAAYSGYSFYVALGQGSAWTPEHADLAVEALLEAVVKYQSLGRMPQTTMVLQPRDWVYVAGQRDRCPAFVGDEVLTDHQGRELQQLLAEVIAQCFVSHTFSDQGVYNRANDWWSSALPKYLSGYVYPPVNLEHRSLPAELAQVELATTLADRRATNWIFFEHFHSLLGGAEGVMGLIDSLPAAGDPMGALARYEGMSVMFDDFERGLTDASISDLGPGFVPYQPIAWDLPLTGPTDVPFAVPRFGVRRLHIRVPLLHYACFETTTHGQQMVSWRPGAPGQEGNWSDDLPSALEGESVMLITSIDDGARFEMNVTDVDDDPECRDDEEAADECELEIVCRSSRYFFNLLGD